MSIELTIAHLRRRAGSHRERAGRLLLRYDAAPWWSCRRSTYLERAEEHYALADKCYREAWNLERFSQHSASDGASDNAADGEVSEQSFSCGEGDDIGFD